VVDFTTAVADPEALLVDSATVVVDFATVVVDSATVVVDSATVVVDCPPAIELKQTPTSSSDASVLIGLVPRGTIGAKHRGFRGLDTLV
jgi:hypothetical protein